METSDEIIDYWESDIVLSSAWNEVYSEIEEMSSDLFFSSVLDVGCGQSTIGRFFDNYTGLEISLPALREAVKNYPDKNYLRGDGLYLPFKDCIFDLVICSDVIEHIKDKDGFLEELKRVSKRYILITTPPEGTLMEFFRVVYCRLKEIEHIDTPYEWRMNKKELLNKLRAHGLGITRKKYTGFRIPFSKNFRFLKSLEKALYKSQIMKGYIFLVLSEKV